MVADRTVTVDGQIYNIGEEIPDLGSLECISAIGNQREYRGLSADADKLPTYDDLATGSSCLMLDTSDYYEFLRSNKTWYKL